MRTREVAAMREHHASIACAVRYSIRVTANGVSAPLGRS